MEKIYLLKKVIVDGIPTWKLKCPQCNQWGAIDDDQYHGRVSILCGCGFHETVNLSIEGKNA